MMKVKNLVGLLLVLLTPGLAHAVTVLDFEDATPYSINWLDGGYKGFNWGDQSFGVISNAGVPGSDYGYQTTFNNSYGSTSGNYAIYNAFGVTHSISFNETIDFIGASFTSWAANDSYLTTGAKFIWLGGYKDGNYVSGVGVYLAADHYDWVQADLANIDRLDIFTMGEPEWWLMDDFTFQKTSVPTPNGLSLVLLGLLLIFSIRKIHRN